MHKTSPIAELGDRNGYEWDNNMHSTLDLANVQAPSSTPPPSQSFHAAYVS